MEQKNEQLNNAEKKDKIFKIVVGAMGTVAIAILCYLIVITEIL